MAAAKLVLAEGVDEIELRVDGIAACHALHAIGGKGELPLGVLRRDLAAMEGRAQADAAFDPRLEHGPFDGIGINTPAA